MYNLYLIKSDIEENTYYKIGITKGDPLKRLKCLNTGNSHKLEMVKVFHSKWGTKIEKMLHRKWKHLQTNGEWFELSAEEVKNFITECQKSHDSMLLLENQNTWLQDKLSK